MFSLFAVSGCHFVRVNWSYTLRDTLDRDNFKTAVLYRRCLDADDVNVVARDVAERSDLFPIVLLLDDYLWWRLK